MTSLIRHSTRSQLLSRPDISKYLYQVGRMRFAPLPKKLGRKDSESIAGRTWRPADEGKTMEHKETQGATNGNGCSSVLQGAGARFGGRSRRPSFAADLRSIVSAAHKLPAEVAPPARVWISLHAQLEKEGILSRLMKGRLEEHTRFPMFRN
jgi:hypothetical protein